jgi:hypothetical protein
MEMVEWRASFNNQCPLNWFKNTINYNKGETINNNLTNMPCQRGSNFDNCHPHWTLLAITKHYNIFELHKLLKKNDSSGKPTKKKQQQMINIYIVASLNKSNNKQGNIKVLMITLF